MKNYKYNDFVFYAGYIKCIDSLPEQEGNLLLRAIVDYGIYGEFNESSPVVNAIMANIKENINATKNRYIMSVENGSRGGRPRKANYSDIVWDYLVHGSNKRELAKKYGVCERTVKRAVDNYKNDQIKYRHDNAKYEAIDETDDD